MAQLKSLGDQPGTLREYETIYILRPNTANEGVAEVNTRIKGIIEGMGGKILKVDNWGKRKLAYEIKKQLKGIYLFWHYLAPAGLVAEVERNLRMLDSVIRFYTVKIDDNVVPEGRPTEFTDETFAKAAETAADEEELMMRGGPRFDFDRDDDMDDDYVDEEFVDVDFEAKRAATAAEGAAAEGAAEGDEK